MVGTERYKGPLEVSRLAPLIAEAIQEFAHEHGLQSFLYYHGEHWWFIRQTEPNQLFREVHVAVYSREGQRYLFCMPQLCKRLVENAPPEVVRPENLLKLSLEMLPEDKTCKETYKLLQQAWQEASKLTMSR